jgi:hypothetical protein
VGNDWQRQQQKVIDHIKAQGFYVTANDKEFPKSLLSNQIK